MHSAASEIKARTVDSYTDLINRLITPALGSVELETLTSDDIRHLLAWIIEAGHERTAELVYVLLHAALMDRLPLALQGIKRPRHRQNSPKPWSDEQIKQYVAACRQHKRGLAFSLAIMLGMRRGEICGLRWRDIDWSYKEIHICNQRVRLASGALVDCSPKSESSVRTIPIPAALLPRLRAERGLPDAYVCPITPSGLSHAHAKLVKQLGLPHIGLHGLRHSFATSSAKHCGDIRSLQGILGHSSYAVTANIYLHPDHDMLSRAIDTPVNLWYNV
jgi:integrase